MLLRDRMRLFIDTEFTDFIDCELISIGIASEDGREFYAERNDFDHKKCNDFVQAAVLPLLGREPAIIGTEEEIGGALKIWISQFESIEVCFDYAMDFELFAYLCRDSESLQLPSSVIPRNIGNEISEADLESYWQKYGRMAHHALHDAKANRYAFMNGHKEQINLR